MGVLDSLVAENSDATSCTNFCTSSARFVPSFTSEPNGPKCTKIIRTHKNMSLGSNGVYRVRSLRKFLTQLRGTNFCTFCTEFRKSSKRSLMHQNCTKCTKHVFRVQWGGTGAFIAKNSDIASWHELLHHFGPFCTEFCNSTKWSPMQKNCTKRTKT
jgi:hypothetical protein